MTTRAGVTLPTVGPLATSDFIREVATVADESGFDSVWMADHVTWSAEQAGSRGASGQASGSHSTDPDCFDPIATLSYIAGMTHRVHLGTAVLVLPARNPVNLAKEIASLDVLSGGRVVLGVGVGGTVHAEAEFGAVGMQHLRRSRGRVTDEWIDVMRRIWNQPTCNFAGNYIEIDHASIYPKPAQPGGPPILIGGDSPAALTRVAQRGDGSIVSRLRPDDVTRRRRELASIAAPFGRADAHFHLAAMQWTLVADTTTEALDLAERALAGVTRGGRPVIQPGSDLPFVGSEAKVAESLDRFTDAGVDEVILQVVGTTHDAVVESMRRFAVATGRVDQVRDGNRERV